MQFTKAVRKKARLRLALAGPSGSGKTHSALLVAKGLGGRIAVIDTERSSASLYSHLVDFDALELNPPFTPERFIKAIDAAAVAGYNVCIIDSITHEWDGAGGCLEANEELAHAKFKGNTWAAWNETTPRHRAFLDAILQAPMHMIVTMRSKTETVQEGGKVKKLGMKAVQREGVEYEFTAVLDMEHERHYALGSKDRTGLFAQPHVVTEDTGKRIAAWLDSGVATEAVERPAHTELAGKFLEALNGSYAGDTEEATEQARAMAVYAVHLDIKDEELYRKAWGMLAPDKRRALKHYIDMAKPK